MDDRFRGSWLPAGDRQDSLHYARVDFDRALGPVFSILDTTGLQTYGLKLVHLGEHWFVDAQLLSWQDHPGWVRPTEVDSMKIPHYIVRLEFKSDTLAARGLDGASIVEYSRHHAGQVGLKVVDHHMQDVTLTDATPKLRRFISRIADADSMFGNPTPFVRVH